jgi:hypothetical protein
LTKKRIWKKGISYYKKIIRGSYKIKDSTEIVSLNLTLLGPILSCKVHEWAPHLQFVNKFHPKFGYEISLRSTRTLNGNVSNSPKQQSKATAYFEKAIQLGNKLDEKSDLFLFLI